MLVGRSVPPISARYLGPKASSAKARVASAEEEEE